MHVLASQNSWYPLTFKAFVSCNNRVGDFSNCCVVIIPTTEPPHPAPVNFEATPYSLHIFTISSIIGLDISSDESILWLIFTNCYSLHWSLDFTYSITSVVHYDIVFIILSNTWGKLSLISITFLTISEVNLLVWESMTTN